MKKYKGFTLIELMVCICIVAIIAAIILPPVFRAKEIKEIKKAQSSFKILENGKISLDGYTYSINLIVVEWNGKKFLIDQGHNSMVQIVEPVQPITQLINTHALWLTNLVWVTNTINKLEQ